MTISPKKSMTKLESLLKILNVYDDDKNFAIILLYSIYQLTNPMLRFI